MSDLEDIDGDLAEIEGIAESLQITRVKQRRYECFIEDHESLPWTPGRCAAYAGRTLHLMRCKRKPGHGLGSLFCKQHASQMRHERP